MTNTYLADIAKNLRNESNYKVARLYARIVHIIALILIMVFSLLLCMALYQFGAYLNSISGENFHTYPPSVTDGAGQFWFMPLFGVVFGFILVFLEIAFYQIFLMMVDSADSALATVGLTESVHEEVQKSNSYLYNIYNNT